MLGRNCLFSKYILWHICIKILLLSFNFFCNIAAEQKSIRCVTNTSDSGSKLICKCIFANFKCTAMSWHTPCITHRYLHTKKREKNTYYTAFPFSLQEIGNKALDVSPLLHWPAKQVNEAIPSQAVSTGEWNIGCLVRLFEEIFWPLFWNQSTVNAKADMSMKAIY